MANALTVYFEEEPGRCAAAKLLTRDEARPRLPELLRREWGAVAASLDREPTDEDVRRVVAAASRARFQHSDDVR
jgi:hypothetical protein